MTQKDMWALLIGRFVKVVRNDGHGSYSNYGTVVHANDSFLVVRDRFNRIHFTRTDLIERISETIPRIPEVKESHEVQKEVES